MIPTTKAQRAKAFACVWSDSPRKLELVWIETGEHADAAGQRAVKTAEALAELEAYYLEQLSRLRAELAAK